MHGEHHRSVARRPTNHPQRFKSYSCCVPPSQTLTQHLSAPDLVTGSHLFRQWTWSCLCTAFWYKATQHTASKLALISKLLRVSPSLFHVKDQNAMRFDSEFRFTEPPRPSNALTSFKHSPCFLPRPPSWHLYGRCALCKRFYPFVSIHKTSLLFTAPVEPNGIQKTITCWLSGVGGKGIRTPDLWLAKPPL